MTCDEKGEPHEVDVDRLRELRESADGGSIICNKCGKAVPVGPTNLEMRGTVES